MRQFLAFVGLATLVSAAMATSAASSPQAITMSVDQDLVTLLKAAIWVGGVFLALLAFIGVAFFGWDVRKARASLLDAQKETRDLLGELKADFAAMKELKEKLEQLGAQLESSDNANSKEPPLTKSAQRTSIDLIREVISSSNFEWTTIERLSKRTGLTRDQILEEARKAPDIRISTAKSTHDFMFKLKSAG